MATIQHRRNIKQYWENVNPVLAAGELGLEVGVDGAPDRFKLGNGLSTWKQLKYFINETEIDIDAGRLSQEALDGRYALLGRVAVPRMSLMMLGDSLTAVCSAYDPTRKTDSHAGGMSGGHSPGDWAFLGNLLANSPMDILGSAATAGMSAEQIRTTHLPTVLVAKPTYCTVLVGANDALGAGDTFTQATIAIVQDICKQLDTAGITPILCTLPPAISTGLSQSEIDRFNSWASYYATIRGYALLDFYSVLVNPSTGGYKTGYAESEANGYLHPTALGAAQQALVVRDLLLKLTYPVAGSRASLVSYNGADGVASNPLLDPTSGTPTVPNGYFIAGSPTTALAASPFVGNRFSMTRTAATALAFGPAISVAEGDVWDFCVRLGTTIPAGGTWTLALVRQDGSSFEANAYNNKLAVPAGTILHWRGKVSPGTTTIGPFFSVDGVAGAKIEVEQVTLRNLTAKGVIVA